MNPLLEQVAEYCEWAPVTFLIISENVFQPLIYYSHIVPVLFSLPLALVIIFSDYKSRLNQYFFLSVLLFSLWSFSDLVLWASPEPKVIMFFWSILNLLEPFIYIAILLFAYTLLFKKEISVKLLAFIFISVLPILLFLHTELEIKSFDLTNCWREVIEGPLVYYSYIIQILFALLILIYTIIYLKKTQDNSEVRKMKVLGIFGSLMFLASFSSGNIIGSINNDWTTAPQYGLFGMPIMVAFLAFLIAKYKMFKVQLLTSQLLIACLAILVLGIIFIQRLETVKFIAGITFLLILTLGAILIRSVKAGIEQRLEIEKLVAKLEKANVRLKQLDKLKSEFVSIASHQLRSPLTSISGYASLLREGTYGNLTEKMKEPMERIEYSARRMAESIEDFLNVSRIESGNMKYHLSDFNLKDETEHLCDDIRPVCLKQGLVLLFKSRLKSQGIVNADIGKVSQILHNLVNNSIKYTPKGTISVALTDDLKAKRIFIDIVDTGIGMSEETLQTIFQKFERGEGANEINVKGTGLGLFVAQKMSEAMGGDITAYSEGEGKGSRFTLSLPLAM